MPNMWLHLFQLAWIWAVGKAVHASSEGSEVKDHEDLASMAIEVDQGLGGSGTPIEYREVVVTVEQPNQEPLNPWTERHQKEKDRLLKGLNRHQGSWSSKHPRHRLLDALYGYTKYYDSQKADLDRFKGLYKNMPKAQKKLLEHHTHYSQKFTQLDHLLSSNQLLCNRIVDSALEFYNIERNELNDHTKEIEAKGNKADKVSVSQSLKHIVRDWTEAGNYERNTTFTCIIESLKPLVSQGNTESSPAKVLLPGAGLGRLGYDIAAAVPGLEVTVNEWSMYMNVAYRYLESHREKEGDVFHPFVDSWSHHASDADMQRQLPFPDINMDTSSVVLVEGDFMTAFDGQAGTYDFVITYFFIDTARNLLGYFETIKELLKPGGYWINLGPLLYGSAPWVQLSLDDIVSVAEVMGFRFLDTPEMCGPLTWEDKTLRTIEAIYSFDQEALTKSAYKAQFWVAQKQ